MTAWAIQDSDGQVLLHVMSASRLEVGRKVVPAHFDAFRLHVSSSYREAFDRAVNQVLEREGWQIVRVGRRKAGPKEPSGRWRRTTGCDRTDARSLSAPI